MSRRMLRAAPLDVTRPRRNLLLAGAAALAAGLGALGLGAPVRAGRPLSHPHALAEVHCATCHASGEAPSFAGTGACVSCHGGAAHAARPAHAAAMRDGTLACATCHPAHEGAAGVTFEGGRVRRWTTGREVTDVGLAPPGIASGTRVPIVSLAACAGCHSPSRASDPVARCVPSRARAALVSAASDAAREEILRTSAAACADEHPSGPAEPRARCAKQHAGDRLAAEEAARVVVASAPVSGAAATRASSARAAWMPGLLGVATAAGLGLVVAAEGRRRRRRAARAAEEVALREASRPLVRRLPVVDPTTCLGCRACVDACPFDVLAVERYVAVVARPEECCGVVLCAQVCPNGSLRIGGEAQPVDQRIPFDEHLESTVVPGVFLAGDLTGVPLVKNAIRQGALVVDRIAEALDSRAPADVDVLVVGAGPAGLSAALRAREKGLSCVVVEQASIAATIKSFPRAKIVHDPPIELPVVGELWLQEASKEELVAQWTRIVRTRGLDVREGHRLTSLERGEVFTAHLDVAGAARSLRARRVVLAIGRRGAPRPLDMALTGRADEHVHHALVDASAFAGLHVLVVGLGDSALEAIVALARQPGTTVTVSYRGEGFRRGKARNVAEVTSLVARGRVRVLFGTVPLAFDGRHARLGPSQGARADAAADVEVRADAVLALLGGEPSWALLERLGVGRAIASDSEHSVTGEREPAS